MTPEDPPAPPMPPGYRWVRHLGAGGFGDVHLAEQRGTRRLVAVKHIQRHALADPDTLERFRREARILAATDVPTVVRVYDLDTSGDPAFLVMEYFPGVTLWDLMEAAPLPANQALAALRDVADALRMMSDHGLVHRDIKPSNVFVLPDGRAKLGDFGLARAIADDSGFRTSGAPAGTPAYFPPEVSSGAAEATAESDAYSFAIMAYEALTGVRPIDAPDAISLITAHWHQPPRPVGDALPGFPVAAGEVLMRALAKDPAGRPLPHEQMAALDAVPPAAWPTRDRPWVTVPTAEPPVPSVAETAGAAPATVLAPAAGLAPATVPATPVAAATPTPTPTPRRGRRRTSSLVGAALGGVLVAALLVGAAVWALGPGLGQGRRDAPPANGDAATLEVRSVTVAAQPDHGSCPRAEIHLLATVRTSGDAGEVVVAWTLPDGSAGPEQPFAVGEGESEVLASLDLDLTGSRPVDGSAAVVVRPGGLRASAPIRYTCRAR